MQINITTRLILPAEVLVVLVGKARAVSVPGGDWAAKGEISGNILCANLSVLAKRVRVGESLGNEGATRARYLNEWLYIEGVVINTEE